MTDHNPSLRKDVAFIARMATALHGIESYPHAMQGIGKVAPIGSLDCMDAHRSKAVSLLTYMDVLERRGE